MAIKTEFTTEADYSWVVTLAQAKAQLRIPTAITDEDTYHTDLIDVCGDHVQEMTGRVLATRSVVMYIDSDDLDQSDDDGFIYLPYSPLTISEVAVLNDAGAYVVTTDFEADTRGKSPRIKITASTVAKPNAVRITGTAGFTEGDCPRALALAVKLLVVHFDENRAQTIAPVQLREIPIGVHDLVMPHRNIYVQGR